ncbi:AGE family epimerase/isomerase [Halomontanus rarus]|uniref:AGE family epimerase/isomerase n=1 Tax=Halomontanus rarus TaxID=3034020 RepID=UPI0023E7CE42|nr:AGE family epimerase/isomerase [Halovivax sp. TS33]
MTDSDPRARAAALATLWRDHAPDDEHGAFHLALSREWEPIAPYHKLPAMLSRQVFGFSAAYLLTGESSFLGQARRGWEYLVEHAWDNRYGGWYDRLTREGEPAGKTKSVPLQLYSNVGLVQYYLVTRDERALDMVQQSMEIRRTHGHDDTCGGYYQALERDLRVADDGKNKHAHYGYVGSLTLNAYLATRDDDLLEWQRELCDLSIEHQTDDEGWIYGFGSEFDRQWNRTSNVVDGEEVRSIGAQLTAALAFLRLYHQTGDETYRTWGMRIAGNAHRDGWDDRGFFWDRVSETGEPTDDAAVIRWVQSYGCFLQLHLYRLTGDEKYVDRFEAIQRFYLANLNDREYGGVFPAVDSDGRPTDVHKARPWKTSYHELEHELLVSLYHTLYVRDEPVNLHFLLDGGNGGETHYVSPVDDSQVTLADVTVNGEPWDRFDPVERSVTLPSGSNLDVRVRLVSPSGR